MSQSRESSVKTYWRSFDDLAETPGFRESLRREFPAGAEELELSGMDRRQFIGLMGASMGLAGLGVAGCVRKPTQYILEYNQRPEDLIPGTPRFFASALQVGGSVLGVLVESQDGRPSKIEGNPTHPLSRGATNAQAQAEVLSVYDPDRSQHAIRAEQAISIEEARAELAAIGTAAAGNGGAGLSVLVEDRHSPTFVSLLAQLTSAYPQARVFVHDTTSTPSRNAGLAMVGLPGTQVTYALRSARVVLSLDSDFLGTEPDATLHAREFAQGRRVESSDGSMNRLYAVEPAFTITGTSADNRLQVPASYVGEFGKALGAYFTAQGIAGAADLRSVTGTALNDKFTAWVEAVGADLLANRGHAVVLVGERQPAWLHALGFALNEALGAFDEIVRVSDRVDAPQGGTLSELVAALPQTQTLVIIGANPVYSATGDLDFAAAVGAVNKIVHLGYTFDETGRRAHVHIPMSHALEAWSDLRGADGSASIAQPLIEPLYPSLSDIEALALMLPSASVVDGVIADDGEATSAYAQIRRYWSGRTMSSGLLFDRAWRRWVHAGLIEEPAMVWRRGALTVTGLAAAAATTPSAPTAGALEVVFALDSKVLDGRFANNGWLQELPDPITKLCWDNAALIGVQTARELGLHFHDAVDPSDNAAAVERDRNIPITKYGQLQAPVARLTVGGRTVEVPVFITPGVAANVVVLPLGYGRTAGGAVADGHGPVHVGVAVNPLRTTTEPWIQTGATLAATGSTFTLATTQDHGSLEGRPLVGEATLEEYRARPDFVQDMELMPAHELVSLWTEPNPRSGQQWGMSIDLTTCIGCNACTIACQAENNIPVVGKERVLQGREMSWIRLDRYYSGDVENPQAVMQPLACMHCETAPCEQVCPVAATVHGPEGTNDMVYNRCIGTRYCANNCPFKVRRFNFFNFNRENDEANPLLRLQRNPDVTVRFRGVMEKCTYCVQRVNEAKIAAKVEGDGVVPDGGVTPACAQVCPTEAIVFGDVNDPNSRVSRAKRRNHDFVLLSWLNIHPRTSYLARIRNPNPAL